MSTTLTEARRIVKRAARSGADDGRFTDADRDDAIKAIGNDFVNRSRCVRQTSTAVITAASESVTLNITGFDQTRIKTIRVTKDSNYSYADVQDGIKVVSADEVRRLLGCDTSSGVPTYIGFDSATAAIVGPLPEFTGTITIDWFPFFTTFTAGTLTPDAVTLNIPDDVISIVLECGAVAKLQATDKDAATVAFVAQKKAEYEAHVLRCGSRGSDGAKSIQRLSSRDFRRGC